MNRRASAALTLESSGDARLIFAIAAARGAHLDETWSVTQDGRDLVLEEIADAHGTRLHAVDVERGTVRVDYGVEAQGRAPAATLAPVDQVTYLRPSRYCESDALAAIAAAEFSGVAGMDLLESVDAWVASRLSYESGATSPLDGAVATHLSRRGVCRDFAHLTTALLRAMDVPARLVSVYAPGLAPMDFHAVTEAWVDGQWWVIDPTRLAPRPSMLRIATGRDAADTAFLTTIGEPVELVDMVVSAVVDALPRDEWTSLG